MTATTDYTFIVSEELGHEGARVTGVFTSGADAIDAAIRLRDAAADEPGPSDVCWYVECFRRVEGSTELERAPDHYWHSDA